MYLFFISLFSYFLNHGMHPTMGQDHEVGKGKVPVEFECISSI